MKPQKVLIVDDEKDYCDAFKRYLTKHNHEVDAVYDGFDAVCLLKNKTYDYIFFDCNMPSVSGVELVEVIKLRNPQAKKIMVTGYDLLNERFLKVIGVDLLISKPVDIKTVADIIQDSRKHV